MNLLYLVVAASSFAGGVWAIFRLHCIDRWARILTGVFGLASTGAMFYLGLQGNTWFAPRQRLTYPSAHGQIGSLALQELLPISVGVAGAVVLLAVYVALKEKNLRAISARVRWFTGYALIIGTYFFFSFFPGRLVKDHALYLTSSDLRIIEVAYVFLWSLIILIALLLAFDTTLRRHRGVVIMFLLFVIVVGAWSPFFAPLLATASTGQNSVSLLFIYAMLLPGPVYWLLHQRLRWI